MPEAKIYIDIAQFSRQETLHAWVVSIVHVAWCDYIQTAPSAAQHAMRYMFKTLCSMLGIASPTAIAAAIHFPDPLLFLALLNACDGRSSLLQQLWMQQNSTMRQAA